MINIFFNIILIALIICMIIDISGIMNSIKELIARVLNIRCNVHLIRIKPFDCSLCMTHWTSLFYIIYLLLSGSLTLGDALLCYAFALFISLQTMNITSIINLITDLIAKIIYKLEKYT